MPTTIAFSELSPCQQRGAQLVTSVLDDAVNVVTSTRSAAVAQTDSAYHRGANLWLSGTSHIHAEQAALSAASSSGDRGIHTLYLAMRRLDDGDPGHLMPCGSCCQLILDLVTFTGTPITLVSLNDRLDEVRITEHTELLPHAFSSRRLRLAGQRRAAEDQDRTVAARTSR